MSLVVHVTSKTNGVDPGFFPERKKKKGRLGEGVLRDYRPPVNSSEFLVHFSLHNSKQGYF